MARKVGFVKRAADKNHKEHEGKTRFSLVPPHALRAVAEVFTHGEEGKYAGNDFREVENGYVLYEDAACRHKNAAACGELVDPESGAFHLAHEISNLMMKLEVLLIAAQEAE
jgi:hypothetical protein